MNWMTLAWSICIGMTSLLAFTNLLFYLTSQRPQTAYLLTAGMAFSAVFNAFAELSIIHSQDIPTTAFWLKIENAAIFGMLISMVWLVINRLPKTRLWLAWVITCLWSAGLIVNIFSDYSLTFLRLDGIDQIDTFGSLTFSMPHGPAHPLKILADVSSLLILAYFVDAAITSYRSGERAKSIAVGASTASFILIGGIHSPLVDAGIIQTPYLVSFAFLTMILFMSTELVTSAVRATYYKDKADHSMKRWQQFIDSVPLMVVEFDRHGKILYANPFAEKLLMLDNASLAGLPVLNFIPSLQTNYNIQNEGGIHSENNSMFETFFQAEFTSSIDEVRSLTMTAVDIIDHNKEPVHILVGREVTEWRNLQRELTLTRSNLERMTRVSLLGELTATIAHELNQPLATILSNAQAARRFLGGVEYTTEELMDILTDIIEQNRRASTILLNIRGMVEKRSDIEERIDLNGLIRSVVQLLETEAANQDVELTLSLAEKLPELSGNPVAIQQVVMNLMTNAIKASSNGNREDSQVVTVTSLQKDENLVVTVADQGQGINDDMVDKLFEPFVTGTEGNIGLGLSIAKRIIENHGGALAFANNLAGGASFTFTLPAIGVKA